MLNLTPTEQERLLVFQAAELARRRRSRGLRLNQAEAAAFLVDEALEHARDGRSIPEIRELVTGTLTTDDVLPG
ncbi:MAG TPA: urease subunit gamma, partial [Ilumatobacteraceae bacterium]